MQGYAQVAARVGLVRKECPKREDPRAHTFLKCRPMWKRQTRFDKFIDVCNTERPHEALDMKCPAEIY